MKKSVLLTLLLLAAAAGFSSFHATHKAVPAQNKTVLATHTIATPVWKEVFLGTEVDQCSGSLSVKDKNSQWVSVTRGHTKVVDVAIDGSGYWYWKCGSSDERSRGVPNYRQRVKRLKIFHSTNGRKITWKCFDLL